jgi:hypothetical protein
MKEADIVYEVGQFWVYRDIKHACYTVYRAGITHSTEDSSYRLTADGLSIAKARVDFLARRHNQETKHDH